MTNEQAIEVINGHIKDSSIAYGTFTGQALRMAIEALKAQLSQEDAIKDTTSDTIYRQAAVDAIMRDFSCIRTHEFNAGVTRAANRIKQLPSAQTEVRLINYHDCLNAMLKMWMDNVVTDGEYNRIMDKLNAHWGEKDG